MKHALEIGKPSYIRIGKKESVNLPTIRVFSSNGVLHPYFSRESANIDTVVISTGVVTIQVEEALQRIDPMKNTFTHCVVPQLSPAPSQWITETLNSFGRIIVVEEHSSIGGLYSLVSELAHYSDVPKEILGVNTRNTFHIGLGEPNEARDALGLSAKKLENYFDKLK
jgi:transketolase C-terminal domain/subunit